MIVPSLLDENTLIFHLWYEFLEDQKYEESMEKFIGANYAFKRSVFDECGLFRVDYSNERMRIPVGEDREFIERLLRNNKKTA